MNASPQKVEEFNDFPVKVVNGAPIFIRDIAHVRDGFSPQTNIVRQDGGRAALLTILKVGNASTLAVVEGVRKLLPSIAATLPPALKMQPVADQSIFVRAAIGGVIREAVMAAGLTGLMILIFLGSWRSTLIIAVSIPLSILTSVIALSFLHETINIMTLGGLALAVGILVDDATVTIENIERFMEEGHPLYTSILEGAAQIAVPALVSTLSICIVFLPMFFLSGVARYLFVPLAEAVVFAMLASYVLSRTLVPTLAMYLLRLKSHARSYNPFVLLQRAFDRGFGRVRTAYVGLLAVLLRRRVAFVPLFLLLCCSAFLLYPWLGQDFFPTSDTGQFKLHMRAKTGTRIEETARICDLVEQSIRRRIPREELVGVLDEIGLPYSSINTIYSNSAPIGPADADIFVSLSPNHRPTEDYVRALRAVLPREFPGTAFYFLPDDIVSQILNFGLPAPIDVQVMGRNVDANRELADRIMDQLRRIPGIADLRIQQAFDQPKLHVVTDRIKAAQSGYTQADVASSLLISLSGSFQTQPTFWLNPENGVSYNVVTQTPQYAADSLQDLHNIPLTQRHAGTPEILNDVTSISRGSGMATVDHYSIQRVVDIYAGVDGRDLGSVGDEVERVVDANRKRLARGSEMLLRGQVADHALVVHRPARRVALRDPAGVPADRGQFPVVAGSVHHHFGFAGGAGGNRADALYYAHHPQRPGHDGGHHVHGRRHRQQHPGDRFRQGYAEEDRRPDARRAGSRRTRFRPVLMTALAMIIGMVPMALGMGEGGEQNAPLGRAVIGGLLVATVATLIFVPAVFSLLHGRAQPQAGGSGSPQ